MKELTFLMDGERVAQIAEAVVETGVSLAGEFKKNKTKCDKTTVVTALQKSTQEQLLATIEDMGWTQEFESADVPQLKTRDSIAIDVTAENTSEYTASNGDVVVNVMGKFVEPTGNNNFKFLTKSGKYIISSGDNLTICYDAGGLIEGREYPFKNSLAPSASAVGYYSGALNFSAEPILMAIIKNNEKNSMSIKAYKSKLNQLKKRGAINQEQLNAKVFDAVDDVVEKPKTSKLDLSSLL